MKFKRHFGCGKFLMSQSNLPRLSCLARSASSCLLGPPGRCRSCDAQRRVTLLSESTGHHETAGRFGRKIAIAVGLAFSQVAVAAPPDNPDPALAPWFESLKQPGTGAPCCSIADCRTVEFRQDRDGYEVLIDGRWKMSIPFWLRVPPNRIIDRTDNPTNRGVVCFTPEAGILCFVRPAES